jgi:hypothetical protein
MPHLSLSEEDIDKIATAIKQKITLDIESIITAKTEPLIFRISKLERDSSGVGLLVRCILLCGVDIVGI